MDYLEKINIEGKTIRGRIIEGEICIKEKIREKERTKKSFWKKLLSF